jgi:hypothetical protein
LALPPSATPSFAAEYCRAHHLAPEAFERAVLRASLYPSARRLRFLLALIPGHFEPDLLFIRHVGRLRRVVDFRYEEIDFNQDRANRGFLRDTLRLRVSARRLHQLVRDTLGEPEPGSGLPLAPTSLRVPRVQAWSLLRPRKREEI